MPYGHALSALAHSAMALVAGGGYVALFFLTLLEGIPLVGMLVPGHVAIIAAGFFAKIGTLNLYTVIIISMCGAILGDFMGFALGRKFGMAFVDRLRPYFFISDTSLDKTRGLLAKHTGKAMILGRFNPLTRALMPFLVGTADTPAGKFWTFNLLGALAWTVISIGIGYLFGTGYHAAVAVFGRTVFIALLSALVIIWGYRFVNLRFHIFKRYELFALILNVLALYLLAKTIQDAFAAESFMANFDVAVNLKMHTMETLYPTLVYVAAWVTKIGSPTVITGLGIAIGLYYAMRFKFRRATIMLLSIASASIATGLMKDFFMRARPDNALLILADNPSFPSSHAAIAAAFFVIVAYLAVRRIDSWVWRELVIVLCVLATVAIGLSRIVLNVHWFSDVVAGWALGVFLATGSILFVRYLGALIVRKAT